MLPLGSAESDCSRKKPRTLLFFPGAHPHPSVLFAPAIACGTAAPEQDRGGGPGTEELNWRGA